MWGLGALTQGDGGQIRATVLPVLPCNGQQDK